MQINKIRIGEQVYNLNDQDLQAKLSSEVQRATAVQNSIIQASSATATNLSALIGQGSWIRVGQQLQTYITSNQKNGIINSAATAYAMSLSTKQRKHIAIPVVGGSYVQIVGNSTNSTNFAYVKSYVQPTSATVVEPATGTVRIDIGANATYSGKAPDDAAYIIINTVSVSTTAPKSVAVISSSAIISDVKKRLSCLQSIPHQRLNWIAMGDSITAGTYSFPSAAAATLGKHTTATNAEKGWANKAAHMLDWSIQNDAIGGTGWNRSHNNDSADTTRAFMVANSIAQRTDGDNNVVGFKKYDLVTLAYGINDWKNNDNIGDISDTFVFDNTPSTAIAGMRKTIQTIYRSNPKIKIIVITPLNCAGYSSDTYLPNYEYKNDDNFALGHRYSKSGTLEQFVQKMIAVCDYYGIQYIDQTHYSCFNRLNIIDKTIGSTTITGMSYDGVHPTQEGHTVISMQMARKLVSCSNGQPYARLKVASIQSELSSISPYKLKNAQGTGNLIGMVTDILDSGYQWIKDSSTGKLKPYDNANYTGFILAVDPNTDYAFTYARKVYRIDSDKQTVIGDKTERVTTINSGSASYLAISFVGTTYPINDYVICKGTTVDGMSAEKVKLPWLDLGTIQSNNTNAIIGGKKLVFNPDGTVTWTTVS